MLLTYLLKSDLFIYLSLSSLLWRPTQLYLKRRGAVSQKLRHCYSSLQLTYHEARAPTRKPDLFIYLSLRSLLWRPTQLYMKGRGGVSRNWGTVISVYSWHTHSNAHKTLFQSTVDTHFQSAPKTQKTAKVSIISWRCSESTATLIFCGMEFDNITLIGAESVWNKN